MSNILSTLPKDVQLTDSQGVITRVHLDGDLEPDGYEVVAPIEAFMAIEAFDLIGECLGWRRFLCNDGFAYVHRDADQVDTLARRVSAAIRVWGKETD